MAWKFTLVGQMLLLAFALGASADEAKEAPKSVPTVKRSPKPASRQIRRDTEGTEAHDRFEAEISIPSKYTLDGKPLEVDPD